MALYLGIKRVSPNMITPLSGVTPSGIKKITDTSLIDVSLYQYAQVSDGNLVAGNIKKGVSILGITGTLESDGGGSPSKLVDLISGDNISLTADDLAGLTKIDDYAFYIKGTSMLVSKARGAKRDSKDATTTLRKFYSFAKHLVIDNWKWYFIDEKRIEAFRKYFQSKGAMTAMESVMKSNTTIIFIHQFRPCYFYHNNLRLFMIIIITYFVF